MAVNQKNRNYYKEWKEDFNFAVLKAKNKLLEHQVQVYKVHKPNMSLKKKAKYLSLILIRPLSNKKNFLLRKSNLSWIWKCLLLRNPYLSRAKIVLKASINATSLMEFLFLAVFLISISKPPLQIKILNILINSSLKIILK